MPLALSLLYCHAAAQGEGMETRWAAVDEELPRRDAAALRRRFAELRGRGGAPARAEV